MMGAEATVKAMLEVTNRTAQLSDLQELESLLSPEGEALAKICDQWPFKIPLPEEDQITVAEQPQRRPTSSAEEVGGPNVVVPSALFLKKLQERRANAARNSADGRAT